PLRVRRGTAGRLLRRTGAYVYVEKGTDLAVPALLAQPEHGLTDLPCGAHHALAEHLLAVRGPARRGERVRGGDEACDGQGGRLPQKSGPVRVEARSVQCVGEQRVAGGRPVGGLDEQGVRLAAAALRA